MCPIACWSSFLLVNDQVALLNPNRAQVHHVELAVDRGVPWENALAFKWVAAGRGAWGDVAGVGAAMCCRTTPASVHLSETCTVRPCMLATWHVLIIQAEAASRSYTQLRTPTRLPCSQDGGGAITPLYFSP